ncbi:hypothetical protein M5K25_005967 [Dendrobium thyrsiflorum]|uniref:Uncharacterized protein n=1 Tax=Dendrobium thyrsiflorum TaxID=117978 RepID=A0ABD0V9X6_DENTH
MGAELLHPSRHTRRTPSRKSSRNLRCHHTSPPIGELYAGSGFASSSPPPSDLPMPRLIYPDRIGYRIGSPATHLITDDSASRGHRRLLAASQNGRLKQEMELKAPDCEFQERGKAIMEIWGRKRAAGLRVSDQV